MKRELKESSLYRWRVGASSGGYAFYICLLIALSLALVFRIWWTKTYIGIDVVGESMRNTLQSGDVLLAKQVREVDDFERGDVIVVDVSGYPECVGVEKLIKRLIAVEGDKVKCNDGKVSICYAGTSDWVELDEPYVYFCDEPEEYDFDVYTVGEGEIFFLGDNRQNSLDSRYQTQGGSHLIDRLYKASDVIAVVPSWSIEYKTVLQKIFFRK